MKTKIITSLATVAFCVLACTAVASAQWPHARSAPHWPHVTGNYPTFYLELEAKIYDRPGTDLGLALIRNDVTNEVLFDSNQATELGATTGVDVRFGIVKSERCARCRRHA